MTHRETKIARRCLIDACGLRYFWSKLSDERAASGAAFPGRLQSTTTCCRGSLRDRAGLWSAERSPLRSRLFPCRRRLLRRTKRTFQQCMAAVGPDSASERTLSAAEASCSCTVRSSSFRDSPVRMGSAAASGKDYRDSKSRFSCTSPVSTTTGKRGTIQTAGSCRCSGNSPCASKKTDTWGTSHRPKSRRESDRSGRNSPPAPIGKTGNFLVTAAVPQRYSRRRWRKLRARLDCRVLRTMFRPSWRGPRCNRRLF